LDAHVVVRGLAGERLIPFTDFHRLPGSTPERDHALDRGDLIVAIEVPASVEARASHYLKVRDRESYEFALICAAAAVATESRLIRSARLALGGVAHKPWRLTASETDLRGGRWTTSTACSRPLSRHSLMLGRSLIMLSRWN
jgi:xanthine dehydrogenase YagS FAD-binding subunit